jgi:hypothetical protein
VYRAITYYRQIDTGVRDPVCGGIYWTCLPYAYSGSHIQRYHLNGRPPETINTTDFNPELERVDRGNDTKSDEFLGVQKFKLRPGVVLATCADPYSEDMQRRWKGGEHILIAPLYSVWEKTTQRHTCPSDFLLRVIGYDYASTFFLPGSQNFGLISSVIRLEYTQSVHSSWLRQAGKGVMLTPEALKCLHEWFYYFITGTIDPAFYEDLTAYRDWLDEEGNVEVTTSYLPSGLYDTS